MAPVTRELPAWATLIAPIRVGVGEAMFCRRNAPEVLERVFGQAREAMAARKCEWRAEGDDAAALVIKVPLAFDCPSCGLAHGVTKTEQGTVYGPLL